MSDFFTSVKSSRQADLPSLLDATFAERVCDLVGSGALVSIGATRDVGAVSFTVTVDGEWRREYFHDQEEFHAYLKMAAEAVNAMAPRPPAPAGRRGRGKGFRET